MQADQGVIGTVDLNAAVAEDKAAGNVGRFIGKGQLAAVFGIGGVHRRPAHGFPVLGGEEDFSLPLGRGLVQQGGQHLHGSVLWQAPQLFQGLGVDLLHHRLLGGQDGLPGLHLGGADKALLPLRGGALVPGRQVGGLLVRLGLAAGGDSCRVLPGLVQQGVRLGLGVGIQPLDDGFNSVHS